MERLIPVVDVIIPAYNEEESIGKVLRDIPKDLVRQIIVSNNNSSDGTADHALQMGAIVVHQPKQGYGNACLKAIDYLKSQNSADHPDIIVFMDADYSDYPGEMKALIDPIIAGKDLVIGSRVIGNYGKGSMTLQQIFGNWLATKMIRLFYGMHFTDLGPFRAIRWSKLLELNMQDKNFGWTVEMQIKAAKSKFSVVEVPVSYRKRIGVSKISGTLRGSVQAGYKIITSILKSTYSN
ncbi:MAG TPA: glycosyltransferase family 2 protein [Saprospiraceae bacterium]|nr:glycosyltransferase family 2 protein [Saprospiraceae bacterium]